jgi:L-lactate dehydrogenase complex protein LldE
LFVTCLVDGLFPDVGKATVALLERLGCTVEVPLAQTCCGQMHINTGYLPEALPLVRRHVAAFEGYEAVVAPSGSCAGSVRHQHAWVASEAGDPGLAAAATETASTPPPATGPACAEQQRLERHGVRSGATYARAVRACRAEKAP